jgi:hypothetical protein
MTRPRVTEAAWQRVVVDALRLHNWSWVIVYPLRRADGSFRTATGGSLAKGWPDLLCFRGSRVIAVELKASDGRLSPEQRQVHEIIGHAIPVYTWRPSDLPEVLEVLRR